ncbi:dihydroneopterin aldolase [Acidihalobacter ferrooxydans]|uniref:7,8-dihydroneopterin aldolase n=1 Tax=Acidihalobacter ferrooxydans TaxID=1765967 RepID=A0A1P8UL64_9GAMM|nr:dihydroneopterin aldolase [Acidihalobacter ferrooxydans]APZ44494.1 dihydroneopterin aldolase [Acidihalobacter ferrooxydans]
MDTVFIRGLRVETRIGVYSWERRIRQILRVDVELASDNARAATSEDIADTVNYAEVADRLHALGVAQDWTLVESYAERAAATILDEFDTPWVRIAVTKEVRLPQRTEVGVVIERGRHPGASA